MRYSKVSSKHQKHREEDTLPESSARGAVTERSRLASKKRNRDYEVKPKKALRGSSEARETQEMSLLERIRQKYNER